MAINVLLDEDLFLAVSKPEGACFHTEADDQGERHTGFVEQVRTQFKDPSLYPVHRLDRVTSGVMLFAKGSEANSVLSTMFQNKQVEKEYIALSHKKPKKKQGLVSGDMVKARGGSYKLVRSFEQPAITRFKASKQDAHWLFRLWPETGKTQQLRVMCKSLGSPILGDARYGGAEAARCYLHAHSIAFELNGVAYSIKDNSVNFLV